MSKLFQIFFGRTKRLLRRLHPAERRLMRLHRIFAASPHGAHIVSWKDARKIYRIVQSCHAARALDLGTGIGASSAFISAALLPEGKVWSVEQEHSFAEEAKRLIPPNLLKKTHISVSPVYSFTTPYALGHTVVGYRTLPLDGAPFDFVLIDGPGAFDENGVRVRFPSGDLFNLLPYLAPRCIIFIDCRSRSAALYEQTLGRFFTHIVRSRTYSIFVYEQVKTLAQ